MHYLRVSIILHITFPTLNSFGIQAITGADQSRLLANIIVKKKILPMLALHALPLN